MQEQKQRDFQWLCWKPIAPDPLYHPSVKAKGTFRSGLLQSLVDTSLSAGVSRACPVLQPTAEQNLILRQAPAAETQPLVPSALPC